MRKAERWTLGLAILGLAAFWLGTGCSPSGGGSKAGGGKKYRIAVIPKGTTHEFWKSVHAGAERAARELGNVEIVWKGPQQENDRDQQIDVVQNFTSAGGVNGIVLAPLDNQALAQPVHDAVRKKIPVVIIDSGLNSEDFVCFVATDNRRGGALAAEQMGKLLKGKNGVIMLRFQQGSASTMEREAGFLETIKKFPDLMLLSTDQYGGDHETAQAAAENLLTKYKEQVKGFFSPNEPTVTGALEALRGAGLAGKVRFIGFDTTPALVEGLKDGSIDALVLQNPVRMGELGVKKLIEHLEGKKVERRIDTGVTLVTKDNMDAPEIHKLLVPEQFHD